MSDHRDSPEIYTGTERLLAFSDGVFAIAITLLVLDIGVPNVEHGVISKLLQQWPSYLGYVLSFFVIGIIWAQHHEMFTQIRRSNHVFVMINVIFLMWVAFLPFPTALLSEGLTHSDAAGRRAVVAIYTGYA
ncbi:MAG: TMEM175 family protein [Thermomicrobiales bacterium]